MRRCALGGMLFCSTEWLPDSRDRGDSVVGLCAKDNHSAPAQQHSHPLHPSQVVQLGLLWSSVLSQSKLHPRKVLSGEGSSLVREGGVVNRSNSCASSAGSAQDRTLLQVLPNFL